MKPKDGTIVLDGRMVPIGDHVNLLDLIRASGIDLPTFCYHSDLSVYGACRLCIVEVAGRGIVTSCTARPEPGMVVSTRSAELRNIRKLTAELLLANHDLSCPTCTRAGSCQLRRLAERMGIDRIRFRQRQERLPVDQSSIALVRDPNKCVLCGDCVRVCREVQGIGVLDFANRGSKVQVTPAFGQGLGEVECVHCGQCVNVCPTGALAARSQVNEVWAAIHDPELTVVAQVAPAVRVGIGEAFGLPPGESHIGQTVAALRAMGFDRVYDTGFGADLTVLEEGTEFVRRYRTGRDLPLFTSCCPAWVKLVEQWYPQLLGNLSTCRSPQQALGRLVKRELPREIGVAPEKIFMVSIMPCTAKKFEAGRPEMATDGRPDVDAVITVPELVQMIAECGLDFAGLEPDRMDLPYGFKSGAGVLFGTTGGVTEAVLRYAAEVMGKPLGRPTGFHEVRGMERLREVEVELGDGKLRLAVVHGLAAAQKLVEDVLAGKRQYDLVEVMACPGGCVGGAGQPPARTPSVRAARQASIYQSDTMLQMHNSQDNPYLQRVYADTLGEPGSPAAHDLLHTHYHPRRRTGAIEVEITGAAEPSDRAVRVEVCVGTNCHLRGSHDLLHRLIDQVNERGWGHLVDITATFCNEVCERGPAVRIDDELYEACTLEMVLDRLEHALAAEGTPVATSEMRGQ